MPETMNMHKKLAFLRDEIAVMQSKGQPTKVMEAALSLFETLTSEMPVGVSHIEKTIPTGDKCL
jgi:hypothetical protein